MTSPRWLAIGGAALAIVVAAVVAFALLGGDNDEPAGPGTTPTPHSTQEADPTATPASTVNPEEGPLTEIGGVAVRDLAIGPEIELPAGAVLFYFEGCYACDGPGLLHRAYRRQSGELVTERVKLGSPADDLGLLSTALAPDAAALAAQYCDDQRCNPLAGFEPGAVLHTLVSTDGGITWNELAPGLPVESYIRGAVGDQWLVIANPAGQAVPRYWLYPSGVTLVPPVPDAHAWVSSNGKIVWREQGDPQRPRHFDADGVPLPGADVDSDVIAYFDIGDPHGEAVYSATARQDFSLAKGSGIYLVATDGDRAVEALRWPHSSVNLADRVGDRWLLGNALYPDGQPDRQTDWPDFDYRPVLIDIESATVHSIVGLPRGDAGWSYPVDIVVGDAILRVSTGGSCLNVRTEPSTNAESLRCYVDGVLLFERDGDAPAGWVAVTTPDGREGWASAEYLDR